MKIAILTLGTRGDVQPYAVLGQALRNRGHEVVLSTAANFESLVRSYGIDFVPVKADYQAMLNSEEGKKLLRANPFAIRRNLEKQIYPLVENSLRNFYELAKTSDRVVYHVKTLADSFADQFPGKMIRAMVVPVVQETKAFPNPIFSGIPIPSFLNRWSYRLSGSGMKMMKRPISRFRKSQDLPSKFRVPEIPEIYGISPSFLEKPKDYPDSSRFTGFWFATDQEPLAEDLKGFLESGMPPLLITFGSMAAQSELDLQKTILRITEEFGIRVILVKGWGYEQTAQLEGHESVMVIDSAPYETLFPLVKAVIHHGGAGTTAECLRAGKPFLACPILYPVGDQQFWGKISYRKGLAVNPVPLKKMTERLFMKKVKELLHNKELYEKAAEMAKKLKYEDGLENAITEIEQDRKQFF